MSWTCWLPSGHESRRRQGIRQRLRIIFAWALARNLVDLNPAGEVIDGALPPLPCVRVGDALRMVDEFPASLSVELCFWFLVLTAARSGEARGAVWDEVALEGGTWAIPAARMKGGQLHRVPLSSQAIEVLRDARVLRDESGLVFPSPTMARRPSLVATALFVLPIISVLVMWRVSQ